MHVLSGSQLRREPVELGQELTPPLPARRLVDERYESLLLPFDEIEAPALSISAEWTLDRFLHYIDAWSAVRHARQRAGLELASELLQAFGGSASGWPERRVQVTWPVWVRAFRLPR
jgi:hypothetical protein